MKLTPPEVIDLTAPRATPPPKAAWIFERTGTGGGVGPPGAGAAPPVTIDTFTVTPRSNQQFEVAIYYKLDPTASDQNFSGVAIYLEDPDISSQPTTSLTPSVSTTLTAAVATGTQTVTPASMAGISTGMGLTIDYQATNQEVVNVTATTATTFTATFTQTHASGAVVSYGAPLNASKQVSGTWSPAFEKNQYWTWGQSTEDNDPADFLVGSPKPSLTYKMARNVRVYLASFGPNSNAVVVRANQPNPTPNIVIPMPAPGSTYARGEEYAWLVTNCQVALETDFNRTDPTYRMEFAYTPPDPNIPTPPGMNPFGGCEMFYAYPDAGNTDPVFTITDSGVFVPETAAYGYLSPAYDPGNGGSFRVYFCSTDNAQPANVNSLIPGVTPYVAVTIVYPPTTGPPPTPDITNFTIVPGTSGAPNPRLVWQPDGSMVAELDVSWVNPTNPNFSEIHFYETAVNGLQLAAPILLDVRGGGTTTATFQVSNWPKTAQQWTITAIAVDTNGKENNNAAAPRTGSPQVIWNIGPPTAGGSGQENAPLVKVPGTSGTLTVTTDQQISSDGVQMMRFTISGWTNPTSNQFGGTKIAMVDSNGTSYYDAGMATTLTTPWQPAVSDQRIYFYAVSYNPQNQQNTIVPQPGGQTPFGYVDFVADPGQIKASLLPTDWFNTDEFTWPTDPNTGEGVSKGFTIDQIEAGKVFVGSILRVGGAPSTSSLSPSFLGQNGQIAVYSSGTDPGDPIPPAGSPPQPTLRAWMGQQTNTLIPGGPNGTTTQATVYGGWFAALYVGGTGPPTSPLYVNNGGIVQVGGWDVQGTSYPYISVKNEKGVEMGRIGAKLSTGDQTQLGKAPPTIGGAWFNQFALGGKDLTDWKLLVPGDGTIHIRGINTFELDYGVNVAPAPPYNSAYKFLLGTDQAYTAAGTSAAKFPGLTLMRQNTNATTGVVTDTTHGITIINRGIILGDATSAGGAGGTQRVALVTFNGDSAGYDTGLFWGELVMFSPTTGNQNVMIYSGQPGPLGSGGMYLKDDAGNLLFEVRGSDAAVMLGSANGYWGSGYNYWIIDSAGRWVGGIKATDMYANDYYVNPSIKVIDSSGEFVGGNISIGASNWISCGQITASNLYIRVGGVATQVIDGYGNWVGPTVNSQQSPWNVNPMDANYANLINIVNITSKNSGYILTDSPSAGTPVLGIIGPGIIVGTNNVYDPQNPAKGSLPNINIQPGSITMMNYNYSTKNPVQTFHVDVNGQLTCATADGSGNWTGSLQTGTGVCYATAFGVWGQGNAAGTVTTPVTFPTGDGRTVTVIMGLIQSVK